ncbi:hypothetical protein PPL_02367 [Heterostelium album PN500]|uniref:Uncharacterized protein n=1 Tax=Heterostelium pallidum (strain ATCC 26659 / Pp 5 / PN500) TaxID=670386 RepID=D3AZI5_HETP5|nr:hypothetical protein PPL_02367 [Heterostelium album PN500]EFA85364.1 hypothetical protein PPL_02367 [Heterostelium album PN500]|eukprot:XP_020437473.1 hypothetical protein PPL_02367 [Heterostelium album PN500]
MNKLSLLLLGLAMLLCVSADSIQLCGVCSSGALLGCGSSGQKTCVTIPVGTCYTFDDICTGAPIITAYYVSSISNSIVIGKVYEDMNDCSNGIGSTSIAQPCGDCNEGTTVSCSTSSTSISGNMDTTSVSTLSSTILSSTFSTTAFPHNSGNIQVVSFGLIAFISLFVILI